MNGTAGHVIRLSRWWKQIARRGIPSAAERLEPLMNIGEAAAYFDLQPSPRVQAGVIPPMPPGEPGFKNLSQETLLALRLNLQAQPDLDLVGLWAEKLMRYCEIHLPRLAKRASEKWGDKSGARLQVLQLASFLLDYYFHTRDLRYLNTALKLADLGWLVNPKRLARELDGEQEQFAMALFQFRILLMSEYAIERLQQGVNR